MHPEIIEITLDDEVRSLAELIANDISSITPPNDETRIFALHLVKSKLDIAVFVYAPDEKSVTTVLWACKHVDGVAKAELHDFTKNPDDLI